MKKYTLFICAILLLTIIPKSFGQVRFAVQWGLDMSSSTAKMYSSNSSNEDYPLEKYTGTGYNIGFLHLEIPLSNTMALNTGLNISYAPLKTKGQGTDVREIDSQGFMFPITLSYRINNRSDYQLLPFAGMEIGMGPQFAVRPVVGAAFEYRRVQLGLQYSHSLLKQWDYWDGRSRREYQPRTISVFLRMFFN